MISSTNPSSPSSANCFGSPGSAAVSFRDADSQTLARLAPIRFNVELAQPPPEAVACTYKTAAVKETYKPQAATEFPEIPPARCKSNSPKIKTAPSEYSAHKAAPPAEAAHNSATPTPRHSHS